MVFPPKKVPVLIGLTGRPARIYYCSDMCLTYSVNSHLTRFLFLWNFFNRYFYCLFLTGSFFFVGRFWDQGTGYIWLKYFWSKLIKLIKEKARTFTLRGENPGSGVQQCTYSSGLICVRVSFVFRRFPTNFVSCIVSCIYRVGAGLSLMFLESVLPTFS